MVFCYMIFREFWYLRFRSESVIFFVFFLNFTVEAESDFVSKCLINWFELFYSRFVDFWAFRGNRREKFRIWVSGLIEG